MDKIADYAGRLWFQGPLACLIFESASPTKRPSMNQHVWEFLDYYIARKHPPHYGVMISGPWGAGKTYLIKEFLRRNNEKLKKPLYVTLYGLSSIAEIDDAVFQASFPLLGGKAAKIVGKLAKTALKHYSVDPGDLRIRDVLPKLKADIYVFDDLERCDAPINQVLGYINQFVEHDGAKVIIIGNEREIEAAKRYSANSAAKDSDEANKKEIEEKAAAEYQRRREKLIGKTLEVQSALEEAFSQFVAEIDDEKTRNFFTLHAGEIAALYRQSEINNLRILQQVMWDFERLSGAIKPEFRKNADAMVILMSLLFALSFEFKAARLDDNDIRNGRGIAAITAAHLGKKNTRMMLASERYPNIDLHDAILSNEVLADYLSRGVLNQVGMNASLAASRFFVKVADEEPWRTVWNWSERNDDDWINAVEKLEAQFTKREFQAFGKILHVMGLRLFLSDIGVLTRTREDVVRDGRKYIDDLYESKNLEVRSDDDFSEVRFNGFEGLGFVQHETPEFKELADYLRSAIKRASEDSYPQKADELIHVMQRDVDLFYRRLCITNSPDNIYCRLPILTSLNPDKFIAALLSLHPLELHRAMMMFKSRYEFGFLANELAAERTWVEAVRKKLIEKANGMSPIGKYRLLNYINWYMAAFDPAPKSGE